jgi:hypothetical protein
MRKRNVEAIGIRAKKKILKSSFLNRKLKAAP